MLDAQPMVDMRTGKKPQVLSGEELNAPATDVRQRLPDGWLPGGSFAPNGPFQHVDDDNPGPFLTAHRTVVQASCYGVARRYKPKETTLMQLLWKVKERLPKLRIKVWDEDFISETTPAQLSAINRRFRDDPVWGDDVVRDRIWADRSLY